MYQVGKCTGLVFVSQIGKPLLVSSREVVREASNGFEVRQIQQLYKKIPQMQWYKYIMRMKDRVQV